MFEHKSRGNPSQNQGVKICLTTQSGIPVEFIYQGVRFHINQKLTTWLQSNRWWQRLDQGEIAETVSKHWQVEAAPVGALTTFEIEFNQESNSWRIRPSSRVKINE